MQKPEASGSTTLIRCWSRRKGKGNGVVGSRSYTNNRPGTVPDKHLSRAYLRGAESRQQALVEEQRFGTELAALCAGNPLKYLTQRPSEDFRPDGLFTRRRATVDEREGGLKLVIPKDLAVDDT